MAALAVLIGAGAILIVMNRVPPQNEPDPVPGAVSQAETPQSTEAALRATVRALETQAAEMQAQLDAGLRPTGDETMMPTVPPPGFVATASPMFTATFTVTPTITATVTHTATPTIAPTVPPPVVEGGQCDRVRSGSGCRCRDN